MIMEFYRTAHKEWRTARSGGVKVIKQICVHVFIGLHRNDHTHESTECFLRFGLMGTEGWEAMKLMLSTFVKVGSPRRGAPLPVPSPVLMTVIPTLVLCNTLMTYTTSVHPLSLHQRAPCLAA